MELKAYDYGGFTRVKAMHGASTAEFRLPVIRPNGDWLPAVGWRSYSGATTTAYSAVEDAEIISDGTAPGPTQTGDGLTAFEEYRGFVVGGQHLRLDTTFAQLFVNSPFTAGAGDATKLPVTIFLVGFDEIGLLGEINLNYDNNGWGGDSPVHYHQKAVRILDGGYDSDDFGRVKMAGTSQQLRVYGLPPVSYGDTLILPKELERQVLRRVIDSPMNRLTLRN